MKKKTAMALLEMVEKSYSDGDTRINDILLRDPERWYKLLGGGRTLEYFKNELETDDLDRVGEIQAVQALVNRCQQLEVCLMEVKECQKYGY